MLLVCGIGMIGMFAITWSLVQHAISEQTMVRLLPAWVICFGVVLFIVILNYQKAIRRLKERSGYVEPILGLVDSVQIQNQIFIRGQS